MCWDFPGTEGSWEMLLLLDQTSDLDAWGEADRSYLVCLTFDLLSKCLKNTFLLGMFSRVYWSSCDQSSEDLEEGASLSSLFLICPTDTGVSCSYQAHTMVPALR